jgi:predicted anti-sigma-YlaC factor YlaD
MIAVQRCIAAFVLTLLCPACSIRRLAVSGLADALAGSATVFAREEDPELVRAALPFALESLEALLLEQPENRDLLVSASAGFALYGYAFVELEAERLEGRDYTAAEQLRERALRLYLRARDHALRGLELGHPGIGARLRRDPAGAAAELGPGELHLAYWTGATWGLAISLGKNRPELLADVEVVRALLVRTLELDEGYQEGAAHEAMIALEGLPRAMGGSPERARQHYARALELSGGRRASTHLALAENVSIPAQDRAEFETLLDKALAVDRDAVPAARLANILAQERALRLRNSIDELFLPPLE